MQEYERLYREHVQAVFAFSLSCVGRRDIAEDITSETFLELYRNMDRVDTSRVQGWLLTVARNRAVDYWRRRVVEQRYAEEAAAIGAQVQPPAAVGEPWLFDSTALKPVHRVCLILKYVHGMTRDEIARQTGLTETQIKGHLQYALRLLRAAIAKGPR